MLSEGREFLEHLEQVADPDDLPLLLAACAGRRVTVPLHAPTSENWIVLAIGSEKAAVLVRRLNEDARYGCDIAVPFNGKGLIASVLKATDRKIIAGVQAGKTTSLIAAECGITRRAVQLHIKKAIEQGRLQQPDPVTKLHGQYLYGTSTTQPPIQVTISQAEHESGLEAHHPSVEPFVELVSEREPSDRRGQILALIERFHGRAVKDRIVRLSGGRLISFHPRAIRRVTHPFRAALEAREAALLTIKIVAAGLGEGSLRLSEPEVGLGSSRAQEVRVRLLAGERPQSIAKSLGVNANTVRGVQSRMRKRGLLPAAKRLKHFGYKGL